MSEDEPEEVEDGKVEGEERSVMDTKDEHKQLKRYYELVPGIRGPNPMSRRIINNGDGTKTDLVTLTPPSDDFGCICQEVTTGKLFHFRPHRACGPLVSLEMVREPNL